MNDAMQQYKTMTLGEWLSIWFETYKAPYLKPFSVRNIEQMIRLHTPDWLKQKPLVSVTVLDIDRALVLIPNGRTRVYARQVWHSAFLKACKLGILDKNVLELTDSIHYRKQRGKALTLSEQSEFLKAIKGTRTEWLMLFYLFTGVRRTEALNLTWDDIDEVEGLILIKGTKTEDSYRHILLTPDVKAILEQQRKQNERDKQRKGRGRFHPIEDGKVFPFSAEHVSRSFKELCPSHHLHDLRHTYITRSAESGVNVKVCQQLVGHSTADMTLNVYTHVMDEYKRKEALKFTIYPNFCIKKDE
jgi:integrase